MTDPHPDAVRQVLAEFGLTPHPDDGTALLRSIDEMLAARSCLRPLTPDDEPAPSFRPA